MTMSPNPVVVSVEAVAQLALTDGEPGKEVHADQSRNGEISRYHPRRVTHECRDDEERQKENVNGKQDEPEAPRHGLRPEVKQP
jgi:hypothetical protein